MKFDILLLFYLFFSLIVSYFQLVPASIAEPALILGGCLGVFPVLVSALRSLAHKKITVDLLASVALLFSLFDRQWQSAVFITMMITSARLFGEYTQTKASRAIQSLLKLRPETVKIKVGKDIVSIAIKSVKRGDLVLIESGDRIPIDGTIVEGAASIDQSSLTGESIPVEKKLGDVAYSATLNVSGSIIVKAEKVGNDTTLEKIIRLVDQAQSGKAVIQTTGERFATWYIAVTFFGAIGLYMLTHNTAFVLSILLVTCADDIAIAIPLAFWSAVGRAAKRGIIVKGGNFIEGLSKIKTLVVDKTGTITKGQIAVQLVEPVGKETKHEVIRVALVTSVISSHPISKAVFTYCLQALKITHVESPKKFREYPGKGIIAHDARVEYIVGNKKFLEENGVPFSFDMEKRITVHERHGRSVLLVSKDGVCIGIITLSDQIRDHMSESITELKNLGVEKVIMLSGDNELVTKRVAQEVGIDEFHASMLPAEKVEFIEKICRNEGTVAMVGDGVNDAAALARADIGIAMGVIGSDVAIESADIALMKDDFSKIAEGMIIGKFTVRVAKVNFIIWGLVNCIGLGLVFTGSIGPQGAAAYNFITDFLPLFNSLRILVFPILPYRKKET